MNRVPVAPERNTRTVVGGLRKPSLTSSVAANEQLVRRFINEIWNERRLPILDELIAGGHVAEQRELTSNQDG